MTHACSWSAAGPQLPRPQQIDPICSRPRTAIQDPTIRNVRYTSVHVSQFEGFNTGVPNAAAELCHLAALAAGEMSEADTAAVLRQALWLSDRDPAAADRLAQDLWCESRGCRCVLGSWQTNESSCSALLIQRCCCHNESARRSSCAVSATLFPALCLRRQQCSQVAQEHLASTAEALADGLRALKLGNTGSCSLEERFAAAATGAHLEKLRGSEARLSLMPGQLCSARFCCSPAAATALVSARSCVLHEDSTKLRTAWTCRQHRGHKDLQRCAEDPPIDPPTGGGDWSCSAGRKACSAAAQLSGCQGACQGPRTHRCGGSKAGCPQRHFQRCRFQKHKASVQTKAGRS